MTQSVFLSHATADLEAVTALADALEAQGIEVWLDSRQITTGDDLVAHMNRGLAETDVGLVVLSEAAAESRWVEREISSMIWASVKHGKPLIPVTLHDDAPVPPLLWPLLRRDIREVDAIAHAITRHRKQTPLFSPDGASGPVERLTLRLTRIDDGLEVTATLRGQVVAREQLGGVPSAVIHGVDDFLTMRLVGTRREFGPLDRATHERQLRELGDGMRALCLPGAVERTLVDLLEVEAKKLESKVEVAFESEDPALLSLPFETLRLQGGDLLVMHPKAIVLRRLAGEATRRVSAMPGPLKVLVAVGAPDDGATANVELDQELELQAILDAVEIAEGEGERAVEVRLLEVGSPEAIGEAFKHDDFHVLHLSCHGKVGSLELENEVGEALSVTAEDLLEPLHRLGKSLPLVVLNTCHGAVRSADISSVAEALLQAGVGGVVAMQRSVSDHYATVLAGRFYAQLATLASDKGRVEPPLASRALALARASAELARRKALSKGTASPADHQSEVATPTLMVMGKEAALFDPSLPKVKLKQIGQHDPIETALVVPQLRIGDLVGRKEELRKALHALRTESGVAGVQITGMGGVGKSAVAGRILQRQTEQGWSVAAIRGPFDLAQVANAIAGTLKGADAELAEKLAGGASTDQDRFRNAVALLGSRKILLALDDFEQNLTGDGSAFIQPEIADQLRQLVQAASQGRVLVTCRYPVPGFTPYLEPVPLGPLNFARTRRLVRRLPALSQISIEEFKTVRRLIGGHPRMLEMVDALLRGGRGRLPSVTAKLEDLAEKAGLEVAGVQDLDESIESAIQLGTRDVLLEELAAAATERGAKEALFQLAVSSLPVSAEGLAHMLADGEPSQESVREVEKSIAELEQLSLAHRFADGSASVHRWTAEGLAQASDEVEHHLRLNRAGRYRWWRVQHQTHSLEDSIEAVRNHLSGRDFDAASQLAYACLEAMKGFNQTVGLSALAAEVLRRLPASHSGFAAIADREIDALVVLGDLGNAQDRLKSLGQRFEELLESEPGHQKYQRDLSVVYEKKGDLYRALGQGEAARRSFESSLAIAERLASLEPGRSDFQRDLSVSHERMGDLYSALGQGEAARRSFESSLAIRERLASLEPDRSDFQRDLSVSHERMGDLYSALGQGEAARRSFESSLAIRERLASL
ncbi:MAG: TIR domain-containing protein, partial [Acidobacteriota bacterium]